MLVVDASATVELLLRSDLGASVQQRVRNAALQAPNLIHLEVIHTLRRLVLHRQISASRAEEALDDLAAADISVYPERDLLRDIWQLRDSLSAYDAAYVALAEVLRVPLVTCDNKVARAHGHSAMIELI